ncbi:hypothetical protein B0H21DRAFT_699202 [Amylocystis lapponica]|nr:hypothetical protein B0H21DRAFT_699202 [Amylocystis lapponica]
MDEREDVGVAATDKAKAKANDVQQHVGNEPPKSKHKIRKLAAPRPFPVVPASVSATGPRSAHTEGKNYICITRKTQLGAYLRRCKDVILKDGYKTLHLSAMGAAIPHLMLLALSLPPILPFAQDEVHTEILTGTVEVQDEVIPDDEDEDITYQTRGKSTVSVIIRIGDGVDEVIKRGKGRGGGKGKGKQAGDTVGAAGGKPGAGRAEQKQGNIGDEGGSAPKRVVIREEDLDPSD